MINFRGACLCVLRSYSEVYPDVEMSGGVLEDVELVSKEDDVYQEPQSLCRNSNGEGSEGERGSVSEASKACKQDH